MNNFIDKKKYQVYTLNNAYGLIITYYVCRLRLSNRMEAHERS